MTLIVGVFGYAPIGNPTDTCDWFVGEDALCGMPHENDDTLCNEHLRAIEAREYEGEKQADLAVERYYEGGWDATGEYSYDPNEEF